MKTLSFVFLMTMCFFPGLHQALAHETRRVGETFDVVIGFANEPAFAGEMNGVDLRVHRGKQPVEGLQDSLRVEVFYDDRQTQSLKLKFEPKYKAPGSYTAHFLPAQPGRYIFHIKGQVKGMPVDEWFTSGPDTFSEVRDTAVLRFPQDATIQP